MEAIPLGVYTPWKQPNKGGMAMSKRTRMSQLDKVFERADRGGAFVGLDVHKGTINVALWRGLLAPPTCPP